VEETELPVLLLANRAECALSMFRTHSEKEWETHMRIIQNIKYEKMGA